MGRKGFLGEETVTFTLKLPSDLFERVKEFAYRSGCSVQSYVRACLMACTCKDGLKKEKGGNP